LLTWLDQEEDTSTRHNIIKVLGRWRGELGAKEIGIALLERLNGSLARQDNAALYRALASLTVRQTELVEPVRTALLKDRISPVAVAALLRLEITAAKRAIVNQTRPGDRGLVYRSRYHKHVETIGADLFKYLIEISSSAMEGLRALLDAGTDDDDWDCSIEDHHDVLAVLIRMYIEHSPRLLKALIAHLQQAAEGEDWQSRRMALAAVLACAEIMPTTLRETAGDKLESLLIKCATDAESPSSRRFALTTLSYLGMVTPAIVPVLLAGCQDSGSVQQAALISASRFQSIQGDLLPELTWVLKSKSASSVYAAICLLETLGLSPASDSTGVREQILRVLAEAFRYGVPQREIHIAGKDKSKLEDKLYTALLRVAGWVE
jgi:hypothetical protein